MSNHNQHITVSFRKKLFTLKSKNVGNTNTYVTTTDNSPASAPLTWYQKVRQRGPSTGASEGRAPRLPFPGSAFSTKVVESEGNVEENHLHVARSLCGVVFQP